MKRKKRKKRKPNEVNQANSLREMVRSMNLFLYGDPSPIYSRNYGVLSLMDPDHKKLLDP